MVPSNLSAISFENYSSQAQNGFKRSEEESLKCANIKENIDKFYLNTKAKQGFIGKTWDKIKCFFNFKTSSKNTDKIIEKYENDITNSSNEACAIIAMNKYAESQEIATIATRNFGASAVAGGVYSLGKKLIKSSNNKLTSAIIVSATAIGALAGVAIKALDAKSANRTYDKKELMSDFTLGSVQSLLSSLCSFGIFTLIGNKLSTIPKMVLKSCLKFVYNTFSAFSSSVLENKFFGKVLSFSKFSSFSKESIMQKVQEEKKAEEYQFYNPRYELNNNKSV